MARMIAFEWLRPGEEPIRPACAIQELNKSPTYRLGPREHSQRIGQSKPVP
jgi:hypothetical protein